MRNRQINHVTVTSPKITQPLTLALVADLHNAPYQDLLPHLQEADGILILGDLINRHRQGLHNALGFLHDAPALAPTFYAIGNHEWRSPQHDEYWPHVLQSSVTLLDNRFLNWKGITLGGLSSAPKEDIRTEFLADMALCPGYKLLMCHHPEWFPRFVAQHPMDLTLSGHAHGGQVRLFGHGLYAPGQGIFPQYTAGQYFHGRLLVSRGLTNSAAAPRINNPCELILLRLQGEESQSPSCHQR